ncbi:MAG: hypothetical protein P4M11_10120 [Candidatus Pacebacteria bacterium]|nr:hypothetical protein [Candidatus Paceibacterota bacterium]
MSTQINRAIAEEGKSDSSNSPEDNTHPKADPVPDPSPAAEPSVQAPDSVDHKSTSLPKILIWASLIVIPLLALSLAGLIVYKPFVKHTADPFSADLQSEREVGEGLARLLGTLMMQHNEVQEQSENAVAEFLELLRILQMLREIVKHVTEAIAQAQAQLPILETWESVMGFSGAAFGATAIRLAIEMAQLMFCVDNLMEATQIGQSYYEMAAMKIVGFFVGWQYFGHLESTVIYQADGEKGFNRTLLAKAIVGKNSTLMQMTSTNNFVSTLFLNASWTENSFVKDSGALLLSVKRVMQCRVQPERASYAARLGEGEVLLQAGEGDLVLLNNGTGTSLMGDSYKCAGQGQVPGQKVLFGQRRFQIKKLVVTQLKWAK